MVLRATWEEASLLTWEGVKQVASIHSTGLRHREQRQVLVASRSCMCLLPQQECCPGSGACPGELRCRAACLRRTEGRGGRKLSPDWCRSGRGAGRACWSSLLMTSNCIEKTKSHAESLGIAQIQPSRMPMLSLTTCSTEIPVDISWRRLTCRHLFGFVRGISILQKGSTASCRPRHEVRF